MKSKNSIKHILRASFLFIVIGHFTCFLAPLLASTVLIDPGHGGTETGAQVRIGKRKEARLLNEKDIALSVAKKIHRKLLSQGITSFLTRSIDRTVSLDERADLVQKLRPDVYISIHLNASTAKASHGFETYYLDNHDSVAVRRVEELENRDLKGDGLVINQILLDLVIDRTATESKALARSIHKNVRVSSLKKMKIADRGVRPALFYVLALAKKPAVLLELGFMTNEEELSKLLDSKNQDLMADDIVKGLREYFKK